MLIAFSILAGIGGLAVYTTFLYYFLPKKWPTWRSAIVLLLVVILTAGPLIGLWLKDSHDKAMFNTAVQAFTQRYEQGQLLNTQHVSDTWVYSFLNEGQPHLAIRVGTDWFEVELPTTEAEGQ